MDVLINLISEEKKKQMDWVQEVFMEEMKSELVIEWKKIVLGIVDGVMASITG